MARQTIVLSIVLVAAALIVADSVHAQPKPVQPVAPVRPDLRPGDLLEVIDMGRLREAEFVEFTPVGLIKVRFEDDSQMAFRPTHVRFAKGARDPKAAAATVRGTEPNRADPAASDRPEDLVGMLKSHRKWRDASGQFSIEADFIDLTDGRVQLKKTDGRILTMPLEKLALADQEIAKRLAEVANPFELNVTAAKPEPITKLNISLAGARRIHPIPDAAWSVKPDPAPSLKSFPTAPLLLPGEERYSIYGTPLLDVGNGWCWFQIRDYGRDEVARIERIDLLERKQLARFQVPLQTKILAISPSGKWLAVLLDGGSIKERDFQLWNVNGQEVRPLRSLTPFTSELVNNFNRIEGNEHNVISAEFVDDDHLFVVGHGPGVLLDLRSGKGVYMINSDGTFSPNRKYLASCVTKDRSLERELVVLDALTGTCVGKLDLEAGGAPSRLAFNSAGTKLAGFNERHVWVWDLQNGQVETAWHDVTLPSRSVNLSFGTHDHLIFNGDYCFSLRDGIVSAQILWPYGGLHDYVRFLGNLGDRSWFYVSRSGRQPQQPAFGLASYELPGGAIIKAYEGTDNSNLLVFKPGSRVVLKYQGLPPEMIAEFRTGVATEFTKKNWVLAEEGEAADFEVLYTLENAPAVERTYYRERGQINAFKVMTHPQVARVQLKKKGEDAVLFSRWTKFEARPDGYLIDAIPLAEAALPIRDWKFFTDTRIPARLIKYPNSRESVLRVRVDANGQLAVEK